jgi:phenylpropionate dioxygenase-like ring-hydroxylating dioxygenase large terminal subunit
MNSDDLMFEYLLQMGAMQPEQSELKRKQAMVDALRQSALTPQQGQMIGKHYVAPGIGNAISQMGQAYLAKQQQGNVDAAMQGLNQRQREMLEELRRRRMQSAQQAAPTPMVDDSSSPQPYDPYAQFRLGNGI